MWSFQNAVFLRTKFSKSNLTNADFSNAYLSGAEFDNTNLSGAIFKGVIEATFSQNGDRFRFIFDEDGEMGALNYEDENDFRPYEDLENYKIKIKEGCKTFNYLLESGALTKDQLKQMLGPISEENGRSAAHNFLEQFSYQINEQGLGLEIEEQIYALMAKVREVDQRIRPEELSEIEENETEETNEIEEAEETNEAQEVTFDNNLEISFENLLEQIASNENQIMITEFDIANDFSMGTEEYEEHHFKNDGATNAQSQEITNEIAQIESKISNDLVSFGSIRVGNRIKNEENENLARQSSEELENQSDKKRKNSPNTSPGGHNARSFQSEEKKIKIENERERL